MSPSRIFLLLLLFVLFAYLLQYKIDMYAAANIITTYKTYAICVYVKLYIILAYLQDCFSDAVKWACCMHLCKTIAVTKSCLRYGRFCSFMMTSSRGNIFRVTGPLCRWPVTGEFPSQRPVTRRFDFFFNLRLNKRLSKQSWGWWFETPAGSLWRHSNG